MLNPKERLSNHGRHVAEGIMEPRSFLLFLCSLAYGGFPPLQIPSMMHSVTIGLKQWGQLIIDQNSMTVGQVNFSFYNMKSLLLCYSNRKLTNTGIVVLKTCS